MSESRRLQRSSKKIQRLLNEHKAILTGQSSWAISTAAEPIQPEFAVLGMDLILFLAPASSPAAVMDTNMLIRKM